MRIGIDGYNLAIPNGTGVSAYAFTLADTLPTIGAQVDGVFGIDAGRNPALRETLFFERFVQPQQLSRGQRRRRRLDPRLLAPWIRGYPIPNEGSVDRLPLAERLPQFDRLFTAPGLFERARLHFQLFGRLLTLKLPDPPEIMHWTYPVPIRLDGARNIYTLHDLVPLRMPYTTLDQKDYYHALVTACISHGDLICTVSEASRADILDRFEVDPDRVVNTYQAASLPDAVRDEDDTTSARIVESAYGLRPNGYFLYFGAIEPKKNVGRLLEAYFSLETDTPLVIVGGRAWSADVELTLLSERTTDRVLLLDYLPRRTLLRLVRNARAVAFPSLYEGFGLPVHEAMLLGTPVLTSDSGGLSEVAGDGALIVDPFSSAAIARGLSSLDGDAALRNELSIRGRAHAQRFSKDEYRRRLLGLYGKLVDVEDAPPHAVDYF